MMAYGVEATKTRRERDEMWKRAEQQGEGKGLTRRGIRETTEWRMRSFDGLDICRAGKKNVNFRFTFFILAFPRLEVRTGWASMFEPPSWVGLSRMASRN